MHSIAYSLTKIDRQLNVVSCSLFIEEGFRPNAVVIVSFGFKRKEQENTIIFDFTSCDR